MTDTAKNTGTIQHSGRIAEAGVDPLFLNRWSPVSFSKQPLSQAQIDALFEAARWAPSSFNEQPWLFVYGSTEEQLERMRPLLVERNRTWADQAPLLIFVFAKKHFDRNGKINPAAAFDTGAATLSLSLQAVQLGLHTHAMAGIVRQQIYPALGVPEENFEAICALVVGYHEPRTDLPSDISLKDAPSARKPRAAFAFPGTFLPRNPKEQSLEK